MMRLNATRLTFALILILGGSKAEKSLKTHLPEDALFWAHRELEDGSMPPAPTEPAPSEPAPSEPAPTEPAPTEPAPSEPAPTEPAPSEPAPTEPAPTVPAPSAPGPTETAPSETTPTVPVLAPTSGAAPACGLEISISCTTGEGIECSEYVVTEALCFQDVLYEYTFSNTGSAPIEITEASSLITGKAAQDILEFIIPTTLEPGGSTSVTEQNRVDFCANTPTTATVTATASPEPCDAEASYEIVGAEGGRRALRVK